MRIALIMLAAFLIGGCSVEKRAQRNLNRAIKLNPAIIQKQYTDTLIRLDTLILKPDTVFVPGDTSSSSLGIDSVSEAIKRGDTVRLIDNDRVSVEISGRDGNLNTSARVKPIYIHEVDTVKVEIEKEVRVPGQVITRNEPVRGFFWWVGLVAVIALTAVLVFKLIRK